MVCCVRAILIRQLQRGGNNGSAAGTVRHAGALPSDACCRARASPRRGSVRETGHISDPKVNFDTNTSLSERASVHPDRCR